MRYHWKILSASVFATLATLSPAALASAPAVAATQHASVTDADAPTTAAVFANRVATFNVCNPCRRTSGPGPHIDQIAQQIATYQPQVIALQEICVNEANLLQVGLRLMGFDYNLVTFGLTNRLDRCFPYGFGFGDALLSAAPLTDVLKHTYTQGGTEPRGYIAATTTVAGISVRVFATHLAQAGQADVRRTQVDELLAGTVGFPGSIVLGDFNAEPTNPELAPMWLSYRDADPACGPAPGQNMPPCQPTANAGPPRKKFDYVWLSLTGSLIAPSAGVHDNFSDHDLVHADLTVF